MAETRDGSEVEVPVLIAGGGLVGLSTALFLAQQGVECLVVERRREVSPLPRAAHFHLRTLELFRLAGIIDEVIETSEIDFVPEGALVAMDHLSGRKLADIIPVLNEGVEEVSPCRRLFITQPRLEAILQRAAERAGARVIDGHEVTDVDQDSDGVTVTVTVTVTEPTVAGAGTGTVDDAGTTARQSHTIRASYVVGADGAHSRVREVLGIPFEGRGVFSNSITIYFTADLSPQLGGKPLSVIYLNHERFGGVIRMDRECQSGFLIINNVYDRPDDHPSADTSEARLTEFVRLAAGVPDLGVRIDGLSRWRATAQAATTFHDGRVLLAGDAAHVMPPNGGFGGNTGVHDAHNLAWKLALCCQGLAGPGLLASYDAERRPVAAMTGEQAYSRYVTRTAPHLGTHDIQPVLHDFEIELGHRYPVGAVLGATEGPAHADPRTTNGEPGTRAPHVWLTLDDGRELSLIDLAGQRFIVIAGPDSEAWYDAAVAAVAAFPELDLLVHRIGHSLVERTPGCISSRLGIGREGVSLIRPDGFVAWRDTDAAQQSKIIEALASILDRTPRQFRIV